MNRAVVLDRDGTIIEERNYLSNPEDVRLLGGCVVGLRRLRDLGLRLIVLTNQSGIGRGYFPQEAVDAVNNRMVALLRENGVEIDDMYVCPHTPEDLCACRKPGTSNFLKAARVWDFDPRQAYVIGDKLCDLEMGKRLGAMTFLVRTGYGTMTINTPEAASAATYVVDDLAAAASTIEHLLEKERQEVAYP